MLKTDVFVWLIVNCKSLNFCLVDTLSAQLHCHMDYFIYCRHANSTHLPYSSFARNFEFSNLVIRILRSTKSQNFTILLFSNFAQQKRGGHGPPSPPSGGLLPLVCLLLFWWVQIIFVKKKNRFQNVLITSFHYFTKLTIPYYYQFVHLVEGKNLATTRYSKRKTQRLH